MAGNGRISLLVDSPLRTLAHVMRGLDSDVKREIGKHTKKAVLPIWSESTKAHATNRMQVRLADSAKVGVTAQNVFLRAGVGRLSSGTALERIAKGVEFGASPDTKVRTRSAKGKPYTRRMGTAFRLPRRGGYVAHPAARDAIPRIASLWVQTAHRTIHEALDKVAGNG